MREARVLVRDALSEADVPGDVVECTVLVVSELVTNVALHARTDVLVTLRFEGGCVEGEVKDWNSRLPQPSLSPADATSGRGLQMVESIVTAWGIQRDGDGKVVWFKLDVNR